MNLNLSDFKAASTNLDRIAWTDEELLQQIQVLQCLCAYFLNRKESMIHFALRLELNTYESYANARKWLCNDAGVWQIRRKDGQLV